MQLETRALNLQHGLFILAKRELGTWFLYLICKGPPLHKFDFYSDFENQYLIKNH
jgi:hypothetical protein